MTAPAVKWKSRDSRVLAVGSKIAVRCTPLEARIIDKLLEDHGRVVSMDALIDYVYDDYDKMPDYAERCMYVRVCYLRKKQVPIEPLEGKGWSHGYWIGELKSDFEESGLYEAEDGRILCLQRIITEPTAQFFDPSGGKIELIPLGSKRMKRLKRRPKVH